MLNSGSNGQNINFLHISPATKLLDKRRQMFEVQEALISQKEDYARREDALRRREDTLRKKDVELQESLIRFNKFLQENENKRTKAEKKRIDEERQVHHWGTELNALLKKKEDMLAIKAHADREVLSHAEYKGFLEKVASSVAKSSLSDVGEILKRHFTLNEVRDQLKTKQQEKEVEKDNEEKKYKEFTKVKGNEVLDKTNTIQRKKDAYEEEQKKALDEMSNEDNALQENANKTKDLGQILASITNILARCEDSFRVRHNKPPRIMERLDRALLTDQKRLAVSQLDEIREFLVSFQEVMDAQQDRERDRAREDQRS